MTTTWTPGPRTGPHAGCPLPLHLVGCPDHREPTDAEQDAAERAADAAYDEARAEGLCEHDADNTWALVYEVSLRDSWRA